MSKFLVCDSAWGEERPDNILAICKSRKVAMAYINRKEYQDQEIFIIEVVRIEKHKKEIKLEVKENEIRIN